MEKDASKENEIIIAGEDEQTKKQDRGNLLKKRKLSQKALATYPSQKETSLFSYSGQKRLLYAWKLRIKMLAISRNK